MIRASIAGYRAVETATQHSGLGGSSSLVPHSRPHFVYTVHVTVNGKLHRAHRRYSEFHRLHQQFRKQFLLQFDFPPKRLRNNNPKVLEFRRVGLERWLQVVLGLHPSPPALLEFLQISQEAYLQQMKNEGALTSWSSSQPVVSFSSDPYASAPSGDKVSVLETGVLAALYGNKLSAVPRM